MTRMPSRQNIALGLVLEGSLMSMVIARPQDPTLLYGFILGCPSTAPVVDSYWIQWDSRVMI